MAVVIIPLPRFILSYHFNKFFFWLVLTECKINSRFEKLIHIYRFFFKENGVDCE